MFEDLVRRNIVAGLALYHVTMDATGDMVPLTMTKLRQQVQLDNFQDGPHTTTLVDADKRYLTSVYPVQTWPGSKVLLLFGQVPLSSTSCSGTWRTSSASGAALLEGYPTAPLFASPPEGFTPPPPGMGFGIGMVYLAWLIALAVLYLPSRWWAEQKKVRTDWWVRYL